MNKIITKVLFLFYRYYDKGSTKSIAYTSSISALIGLIFINVFSIIVLFRIADIIPLHNSSRAINYLIFGLFFYLPMYILLSRKYKKEEIKNVRITNLKFGYIYLLSYILFSVSLLTFLIFEYKKQVVMYQTRQQLIIYSKKDRN